jgi:hypothetical protein
MAGRLIATLAVCLCLAAPARAETPVGTPLSAETYAPWHPGITALLGFPFVRVNAGLGLTRWLDVGLEAKAAWADLQYLGPVARVRFTPDGPLSVAARLSWSALLRPVTSSAWFATTGLQNYDYALDAVLSWRTPRGAVLTAFLRGDVIESLQIPPHPLAGLGPYFGFNPSFHVAAELPTASGLVFSFEAALNMHLSGFDNAVLTAPLVMPEFALGVGYVL